MELSALKGVGKARLTALHAAGIFSLRDLLYAVPCQYRDASRRTLVREAREGTRALFSLRRVGEAKIARFGKTSRVTCLFEDDTGEMTACWFNQPWMKENLMKRSTYQLYGLARRFGGTWQLLNPVVEDARRIVPIYRPIEGVPQKTHEALVREALGEVELFCTENLPETVVRQHHLMGAAEAVRLLHKPESMEDIADARRRITFEQMLTYQAAVRMVRDQRRRGVPIRGSEGLRQAFWDSLPFQPTGAQRRTLQEIANDMAGETAMGRMVQGDVGCGKTAIAFGAVYLCVKSGYQAAFMVPTEILARQHYESAQAVLEPLGISCGLLTGGLPAPQRREALRAIQSGEWQCVIGTHALIQKAVKYEHLGLCITDEQHRFGVGQRTALIQKGERVEEGEGMRFPHLLVMSATPIPRTLALVMFGDLDISVVDELPPGRVPVGTRIVPEEKREDMYGFLRKELTEGRQAYIVCPLVEDSEEMDALKAVTSHMEELSKGPLKGFTLGLSHGRQSAAEKEETLWLFVRGLVQVLVATTVIEVGVNVPNATIMVIEDADRYGLAQLHQLRGRVGRGTERSWCFLLARPNERLRALTQTNDGFEIARKDLELRGPGEILGTAQHGAGGVFGGFVSSAGLGGGMELLYEAAQCVEDMEKDPAQAREWNVLRALAREHLGKVTRTVSMS